MLPRGLCVHDRAPAKIAKDESPLQANDRRVSRRDPLARQYRLAKRTRPQQRHPIPQHNRASPVRRLESSFYGLKISGTRTSSSYRYEPSAI